VAALTARSMSLRGRHRSPQDCRWLMGESGLPVCVSRLRLRIEHFLHGVPAWAPRGDVYPNWHYQYATWSGTRSKPSTRLAIPDELQLNEG